MEIAKPVERTWTGAGHAAMMAVMSFLLCRTVFLDELFPCGVAWITVLMYRNRINLYYIFPMFLGYASYYGTGLMFYGDAMAVAAAALVFTLFGSRKITLNGRAAIAVILTITGNTIYHVLNNTFYRISIFSMGTEAILVIVLIFTFNSFFSFLNAASEKNLKFRKSYKAGMEKGTGSVCAVAVMTLCGAGSLAFFGGRVSLTVIAALFLTLFFGYAGGPGIGLTAGAASSLPLIFICGETSGIALVMMAGAFAASAFSQEDKFVAAVCFSGACLVPGLLNEFPELSMSAYNPLAASAVMILLPDRAVLKLRHLLSAMRNDAEYGQMEIKMRISEVLDRYEKTFKRLGNLYGNAKSSRAIISYQFKGMAQAAGKMKEEILLVKSGETEGSEGVYGDGIMSGRLINGHGRFNVKAAHSSRGQLPGISGDSFRYKQISNTEYGILISDGMGKGKPASAESTLAVSTLMDLISAGFDAELALKTVNNILLQQEGQEIFSTVDLALIDTELANLRMFKIGAAATFIRRRDKVAVVKMPALPLGIVDGLHVDFVNVRLRPGDRIVMISDGVSDADREDLEMEWLKKAILDIRSTDPQTISDLIMNKAIERYGKRERDDMTVITAVLE